jgi:heme oxygenase (mycobilin-producing)
MAAVPDPDTADQVFHAEVRFCHERGEKRMPTVTLINPFEVPEGKEEAVLKMWEKAAEFMKKQPGFVSTRLHRALSPEARFHLINVAEWESAENFQAAINSAEFKKLTEGAMEDFPHYPALYEVIRS